MVEHRPWNDIIAFAILTFGVFIVAFPVYLALIASTHDAATVVGGNMPLSPGSHTLALLGRFDDTLTIDDPSDGGLNWLRRGVSPFPPFTYSELYRNPASFAFDYRSKLEAYSGELQHILQIPKHTILAGVRYQAGWSDTDADLRDNLNGTRVDTSANTSLERFSLYAYENWQILDQLRLTAGVRRS